MSKLKCEGEGNGDPFVINRKGKNVCKFVEMRYINPFFGSIQLIGIVFVVYWDEMRLCFSSFPPLDCMNLQVKF